MKRAITNMTDVPNSQAEAHTMKHRTLILAGALLAVIPAMALAQSQKPKNVYKLTKLSTSEAIVTCQNGADPAIKRVSGDSIIVSCGPSIRAKWDGKQFTCPTGLYVWPDDLIPRTPRQAFCATYPLQD